MNFRDKVMELLDQAETDPGFANNLHAMSRGYLEQFSDWPCATSVPLSRVAQIVVAMIRVPDHNVRRVMATDALEVRSQVG